MGSIETGILPQALAISPINLQVDLSTDILRVGDELIVHVSATNAYSTMLETDENTKQYGDAVYTYHVVFHRNKIRRAWIKVTAYGVGIPRTTSQTVYVRLRFYIGSFPQEAQQTYNNSLDYARGYDMSNNRFYDLKGGWDVMWEFMKFGARYNQTIHDDLYSGEGLTPELAIEALLLWSKEYFTYFYQYGITVSYTGYETAQDFQGFDGEHDTYETFDPGRRYECSSMAAFISSIGLIMGLPARMVSLSDFSTDQLQEVYQHLFAEIYGYSINGNNGWFLIDPARDSNVILSSYDNISEVKEWYAHADGQVKRLWIIWGIDSTGWGENVYGRDRQTSWVGYGDEDRYQLAPNNEAYVPNPWDIVVMDLP